MRTKRAIRGSYKEKGVVITLIAVFMLFVIGAMAAISIDVVTLYTARSEAQLAADSAALAAARVLANSGATSDASENLLLAVTASSGLAKTVALQVAEQNQVGGVNIKSSEVTVNFGGTTLPTNPTVTVVISKNDLPVFFARIWGRTSLAVAAKAIAEAYNPTILIGSTLTNHPPVAPICVKPWLLPNMSPTAAGGPIFTPTTGAVADQTLLGWDNEAGGTAKLKSDCTDMTGMGACSPANTPTAWKYYPGTTELATDSFPAPAATSCTGCTGYVTTYQVSIAGCVQPPIQCNGSGLTNPYVSIDTSGLPTDQNTAIAVNGLTHTTSGTGDSVQLNPPPLQTGTAPFEFLAGSENPIVLGGALSDGAAIMTSSSLVTVPVIDASTTNWPPALFPQVQIIGFVQLFLNPDGNSSPANGHIRTRVINVVGCGTGGIGSASGQAIIGNGASPVAVRLIQ